MRRLGKIFGVGLLAIVVTGMTLWGMGALYYSALPALLRGGLAATFGLATAGAFLGVSHRRRTLLGFVLVWGALMGWWITITPSNRRGWQPDVAVLPSATADGDRVTLHNIRNFVYRTATDFTPRHCESGTSVRGRTSLSKIGSARIRKALYWPAITALRCNPLLRAFGQRLRERGKAKMVVIGAAMRKLIHLAYRF